jgi:hypothetical protein
VARRQGACEVVTRPVRRPARRAPDCAVVSCRLEPDGDGGHSTYARGVGMVRQEIDVVQFFPALHGSGVLLPATARGASVLRLTAFHVGR